jgi:uncharacterized damage-inducible protein DinB
MHKKIYKSFTSLEKRKGNLLSRLEKVDDDLLHDKPNDQSWSITQVIGHLSDAERMSLLYCRKKIQAGMQLPDASMFNVFRSFFLNTFLKSKVKYKMPQGLKAPEENPDFHHQCVAWFNTRKSLETFLEEVPDNLIDKALYKHPFAGRFTLNEMLQFFDAHVQHHEYQIERILKQLAKRDSNNKSSI